MSQFSVSMPSLLSGQGIDVASTVSQLASAARAPETDWQSQQTTILQQQSNLNQLNTELSALLDKITTLNDSSGVLSSATTTSSNSSVVTATAVAGTSAQSHLVVVSNLAATASFYSAAQSSSSTQLGSGSFSITVGTGSTAQTQSFDVTNKTLAQVAQDINNATSLGLNATVIHDSSGYRLAIVADNSGAASDFAVTNDHSGLGLTRGSTGKDAVAIIDGVPVSSANNTISGAISGVTFNLGQPSATEVQVTVAPDQSAAVQAVTDFVNAYNTLITDLNSQFTVSVDSTGTGTNTNALETDSSARAVQQELLTLVSHSYGSGAYSTLTALGVSMNDDGTLSIDSTKLNSVAKTNLTDIVNFFQSNGSFGTTLTTELSKMTDVNKGVFNVDLNSLQSNYQSLQNQIDDLELYVASRQQQWTTEYNRLNVALLMWPLQQQEMDALFGTGSYSSNSTSSK